MVPLRQSIGYLEYPSQGDKPLLRGLLQDRLREARVRHDERAESVIKLIFTALRERDLCIRQSRMGSETSDDAIHLMICDMIKQRQQAMIQAEQTGRLDRVEQEKREIEILQQFLPRKLTFDEVGGAVDCAINETGATCLKDAGKVMTSLKQRFGDTINTSSAKRLVCERLR